MINRFKKLFISIAVVSIVVSLGLLILFPPTISPEFSGSAVLSVRFDDQVSSSVVESVALDYENLTVSGDEVYVFKTNALNDDQYLALTSYLTESIGEFSIESFESFSPSISQELIRKSIIALILAAISIIIYIAYTFRGVSQPISSWKYGFVATLALFHDVVVPIGVFSVFSQFTSASIDTLFVTALLATLGYSVNDTIVIFDRIRERLNINKEKKRNESFEDTVDIGASLSVRRSIYTSISTLIPLAMLAFFVPVTQWFALALAVGVIAGTFSSLFFATSGILLWHKIFPQNIDDKKKGGIKEVEKAEEELKGYLKNSHII